MSTLTITIIQTNLYWEDKTTNLRHFEEKIDGIKAPTQIIVLPEMFSTGFSMKPEVLAEKMDGPTVTWMKETAFRKRIILTGSLIIEEDGLYFNRLLWVLPTGQLGYYDKRHLFAYAGEHEHYTAGSKKLIAAVNGWKINLLVCYDLRFPVWSRQPSPEPDPSQPGGTGEVYDLLIYVANWPERRAHAWKTLLPARAIENQAFVVGVNRIGVDGNGIDHGGNSMIIDPLGQTIWQQAGGEAVFTGTIDKQIVEDTRKRFPFQLDSDRYLIQSGAQ